MIKTNYSLIALLLVSINITSQEKQSALTLTDNESQFLDLGKMVIAGDVEGLESVALDTVADRGAGVTRSFLEQYFPTVEVSLGLGDPAKPTFGVLVVSPLSDQNNIQDTLFTQISTFHYDGRTTINLGLGYRRLEMDNTLLLGVNTFYDHEFPYDHGRASVGLEARTSIWEINANHYWGVTKWKQGRNSRHEKALGGFDIEAGIPLPYMNWAKFYARAFRWDTEISGVKDTKGNDLSLRAEVPTIPGLAIEGGRRTYTSSQSDENFLKITYDLASNSAKTNPTPWFSRAAYKLASMEERRFDKVRRENLILKQKKATGKVTISGY